MHTFHICLYLVISKTYSVGKKMNILLTGGLGFIGSHTAIELVTKGYEIVIVDNLSNSDLNVLNKLNLLFGKSVKFYQSDLRNKEELRKIFLENKFDAVMHFAGLKAVGESVVNPYSYYDNNVIGSLNFLFAKMQNSHQQTLMAKLSLL